ncbi:DNA-binding response regulator [Mucilaginibacter terrenus]|uniref:DNA-binding response regulator n=1 Tax=Mucilaginibacter terrenus TaxID=2482727 RepID=A0A3E2NMW7_9SPHI|nr:LytTR family DNA-binding domain-containing protein [Mucilaginibacter terrenus]RFZ82346.1 DNA-binding response regulator [Mucilaginibacter terrenus]
MIDAIAIDDEPVALDIIRMHTEKIPFVNLQNTFGSATAALTFLQENTGVSLIFLDINMPGMSGLEFAALAPAGVQIIFTTAHADYAVAGFDMAITDFLLKPINYNRFLQACTLALNRAENKVKPDNNILFVKDGYKFVKIDLAKLLYVKAHDNYLNLVEPDKQTLVRMTLQELSRKLPSSFAKVHKSYVVNTVLIDHLESHQLTIAGIKIPIAKTFLEDLKKKLFIG